MSFLEMLRQQQAQPQQSFMPDFAPAVNGLLQGYLQGDQMRRQREQDERQRQQDARAEQEFQRKQLEAKIEGGNKQLQALRAGGLNKQAMDFFNQNVRGLMEQQNGYAPPELVGAPQSRAYDVNTRLPMPELGSIPGGNLPDAKTLGFLDNLSGYKPNVEYVDPAKDRYVNGVLDKKGAPKPVKPSQVKMANGNLGLLYADGTIEDTGRQFYQAPAFTFMDHGQAAGDRRTGQVTDTGYTPQMTPLERAKLGLQQQTEKVRTAKDAAALKARHRALNLKIAQAEAGKGNKVDQAVVDALTAESDALVDSYLLANGEASQRTSSNKAALGNGQPAATAYPGLPLAPGVDPKSLPPQRPATKPNPQPSRADVLNGARAALQGAKRGGFVQ
jgi:hypothetical protein